MVEGNCQVERRPSKRHFHRLFTRRRSAAKSAHSRPVRQNRDGNLHEGRLGPMSDSATGIPRAQRRYLSAVACVHRWAGPRRSKPRSCSACGLTQRSHLAATARGQSVARTTRGPFLARGFINERVDRFRARDAARRGVDCVFGRAHRGRAGVFISGTIRAGLG
jgi:hypothetical protein